MCGKPGSRPAKVENAHPGQRRATGCSIRTLQSGTVNEHGSIVRRLRARAGTSAGTQGLRARPRSVVRRRPGCSQRGTRGPPAAGLSRPRARSRGSFLCPPRPLPARAGLAAPAVAGRGQPGAADCCRYLPDDRPPRPPVRRGGAPAPVPAPFQPHLARPRRSRGGLDGTQRLGVSSDAPSLRRQRPQRPRPPHLRPHHDRHRTPRLCEPPGRPTKIPQVRLPGRPPQTSHFSGRTYPQLLRDVRVLCVVVGSYW